MFYYKYIYILYIYIHIPVFLRLSVRTSSFALHSTCFWSSHDNIDSLTSDEFEIGTFGEFCSSAVNVLTLAFSFFLDFAFSLYSLFCNCLESNPYCIKKRDYAFCCILSIKQSAAVCINSCILT